MASLPPGTRIGAYRILRTLSEVGHFSIVYSAAATGGDREVALKENFPEEAASRARDGITVQPRGQALYAWALQRFEREAQFLHRQRHPNLVRVLGPPIRANNTSYMAMELLTGGSLRRRIEDDRAQGEAEVRAWLLPILSALADIERTGTNHLDLSPDNILFRGTGEPVLVDFGSARIGGTAPAASTRLILNDGFSAPEKLSRTSRDLDARADMYSLAAVALYAMTGAEPASAQERLAGRAPLPTRLAVRRRGSRAFLAAIDRGFALAIADRPSGADAFARAIAVHGLAPPPPRPPVAETSAGPDRRHIRTAAGLFAFGLAMILAFLSLMV